MTDDKNNNAITQAMLDIPELQDEKVMWDGNMDMQALMNNRLREEIRTAIIKLLGSSNA